MSVPPDSRYNRTVLLLVRNQFGRPIRNPHLDQLERYDDIDEPDNSYYTARDSDTLSNVAHRRLGSGKHWWAIGYFTGMVNPFEEHDTGSTLVIPSNNTFVFDVLDFDFPEDKAVLTV